MQSVDGDDPVVLATALRHLQPLMQLVLTNEAAAAVPAPSDGLAVEHGAALVTIMVGGAAAGADVRGPAAAAVAEHVPEPTPKPLGHDAVEQRVDAAAEVISHTCKITYPHGRHVERVLCVLLSGLVSESSHASSSKSTGWGGNSQT